MYIDKSLIKEYHTKFLCTECYLALFYNESFHFVNKSDV